MNCEVQLSEIKGPLSTVEGPALTVGRPFVLNCTGEWPELNVEKLDLRLEPTDRYKLKLLKFEKAGVAEAKLLVTSYEVGDHNIKAVQLVDPEHSVVLGDLKFSVASVQKQEEPVKEPFGPMGPMTFGIPLWFKLLVFFVVLASAALIWWRVARKLQRKRWLLEMKLYERVLSPMAELGKSLRLAQKNLNNGSELVPDINLAYRTYIARVFAIPTLRYSDRQILKEIKSFNADLFEQQFSVINKVFQELKRAMAEPSAVSQRDFEQILQLVRRSAESIDQYLAKKKGGEQ